jgi:hypothetical protein
MWALKGVVHADISQNRLHWVFWASPLTIEVVSGTCQPSLDPKNGPWGTRIPHPPEGVGDSG